VAIDGFAQPWWLVLLVPVAALVAGYLLAQRRRYRAALRFSKPGAARAGGHPVARLAAAHTGGAADGGRCCLLTIGLAGPIAQTKVPRNKATVAAGDRPCRCPCRPPTWRRPGSRPPQDAASKFVQGMPPTIKPRAGVRSPGTPAILVPPTTDRDAVVSQIQTLKLAESTATGEALAAALNSIDAFNAQNPGQRGGPPPARSC